VCKKYWSYSCLFGPIDNVTTATLGINIDFPEYEFKY
jgi:hypothetical protein